MISLLTVNLAYGTFVFWLAARLYLLPRLGELKPQSVLLPILLLHAFRHLGLMFIAPGAVHSAMPAQFAWPAALGDLLAALLAVAAVFALARDAASSRLLVWAFNIVGSADLVFAIALATLFGASDYMGAAYWIPAFWVPALLVTHYVAFVVLVQHWRAPGQAQFN